MPVFDVGNNGARRYENGLVQVDDLRPLREKLAAHRSRIRLILPKLTAAHPEVILLASMFQHYRG